MIGHDVGDQGDKATHGDNGSQKKRGERAEQKLRH